MPQADTKALLAEIADARRLVDMLVTSITTENEQLREQVAEAAAQISRGATLAALLIGAVLEVEDKLSETAKAALVEYEKLHGPSVTQRPAQSTDIVAIVGQYVELTPAGENYKGLCPFHKERTPSFNVDPKRQGYRCFGCGASGDAARFIEEIQRRGE